MSNTEIIRRFFEAWEAKSLDGILELMMPDALAERRRVRSRRPGRDPQGHLPLLGQRQLRRSQCPPHRRDSAGAVLTERTDVFDNNGKTMTVDVMGVFEMKDGKIHAWREYFHHRVAPSSYLGANGAPRIAAALQSFQHPADKMGHRETSL